MNLKMNASMKNRYAFRDTTFFESWTVPCDWNSNCRKPFWNLWKREIVTQKRTLSLSIDARACHFPRFLCRFASEFRRVSLVFDLKDRIDITRLAAAPPSDSIWSTPGVYVAQGRHLLSADTVWFWQVVLTITVIVTVSNNVLQAL